MGWRRFFSNQLPAPDVDFNKMSETLTHANQIIFIYTGRCARCERLQRLYRFTPRT